MLLKAKTVKQREHSLFEVYLYRIPMQVRSVLQYADGNGYPVCPHCACTFDRAYTNFCDRCGQRLGWELYEFAAVIQAPFHE